MNKLIQAVINSCEIHTRDGMRFNPSIDFRNQEVEVEYVLGENFMWAKSANINNTEDITKLLDEISIWGKPYAK